jgi:hypothetical protein
MVAALLTDGQLLTSVPGRRWSRSWASCLALRHLRFVDRRSWAAERSTNLLSVPATGKEIAVGWADARKALSACARMTLRLWPDPGR